jgi:small-conductance mechanosensitive channel
MPTAPDLGPMVQAISGAVIPLAIVLVLALLGLRFARPLVRRVIHQILERQVTEGTEQSVAMPEIQKRVDTLESLVVSVTRLVVVGLAGLLLLVIFDLTPIIAGLGLVIAAFAFAGQDIVKDYLMGFLIILENQYYKGDVVTIDGVTGTVEDLALRRTTLRDLDGAVHIVSNGQVRRATNRTRLFSRVNVGVQVAYGTDMDLAIATIDRVGRELAADPAWTDRILEPPATLRVDELADSGITIKVVGQVVAGGQWAVTGEFRKRILVAFAAEGIEIPFPHRVVISRPEGLPETPGEAEAAANEAEAAGDDGEA